MLRREAPQGGMPGRTSRLSLQMTPLDVLRVPFQWPFRQPPNYCLSAQCLQHPVVASFRPPFLKSQFLLSVLFISDLSDLLSNYDPLKNRVLYF